MSRGPVAGLALGAGLLVTAGALLLPGAAAARAAPGAATRGDGTEARAYFDPEFLRRSAEYGRAKVAFALNARAIRWAAYLTLIFAPLLPRLAARAARRWPGRVNVHALLLASTTLLVGFAAVLPISFASGFVHEHRYGLSRESAAGWLADAGKSLLLSGTLTFALTLLYFALRRRGLRSGWAVLAGLIVPAAFVGTFLYPVLVDPLFYRFRPLEDQALRRDLVAMAAAEGIRVERVLVMEASAKTVRENAYFTGLGRTKRVVLYDNLLERASPAEVRQVFAHELGHWSRGHVVRGLALWSAAIPLLCWLVWALHGRLSRAPALSLAGPADPAGTPLLWLVLSVVLFAAGPVANAVSRGFERQADRVALELTGDARTFIEGKRRMAVANLSWVDPPAVWKWLFWTHPTTLERIRTAERWDEEQRLAERSRDSCRS